MAWKDVTITEAGEQLLASLKNGDELMITRAGIGSGTVPVESMAEQTSITAPITAAVTLPGEAVSEDGKGKVVKIQIRNEGVAETTRMRQIAIFAKKQDTDEILFVLLQDETGEEIPAHDEFPEFDIEQWVTLAISCSNDISIAVNPMAFTPVSDFDDLGKRVKALETAKKVNVVQITGESEEDVMSQKAVTDALNKHKGVTVVQETGESTENVMSQKAVTDALKNAGVGKASKFDATSEIFNSYDGEEINVAGTELEEEQTPFYAHAEGYGNSALAKGSHAEGHGNTIENGCDNSHAEGDGNSITQASTNSHAGGKGNKIQAQSDNTAVFGVENTVIASDNTIVSGNKNSVTNSSQSMITGDNNQVTGGALGKSLIVAGTSHTIMGSDLSGIIGNVDTMQGAQGCLLGGQANTLNGAHDSIVWGQDNNVGTGATTYGLAVFGTQNILSGRYLGTLVQGNANRVNGETLRTYVGGEENKIANLYTSFVHGAWNEITGNSSVFNVVVFGRSNHAAPGSSKQIIRDLFVVGRENTVNDDDAAYVHGYYNSVNGSGEAHAYGECNKISAASSVYALGNYNEITSIRDTLAIGRSNTIQGGSGNVLAIGVSNTLQGAGNSMSLGYFLKQQGTSYQVAVGKFNKNDYTSGYVFIVGCGTSEDDRKNAIEVSNTEVIINNDVTINGELKGYAKKEDIAQIAGNSTFVSVSYTDGTINVTEDSGINEVTKTYTDEEPFVLYDGTNRNKGYTAHFTWTNAEHTKNAEIIGFVRPTGTVVVFNGVISELGSDIVLYADDGEEIGTISINEDRVLSFNFTGDRTSLKMEGYITTFRQG